MAKAKKVPISQRAAVQRVRRYIAKSGREFRANATHTAFFVIKGDGREATVTDLEAFARELGVLKAWERVESKEGK